MGRAASGDDENRKRIARLREADLEAVVAQRAREAGQSRGASPARIEPV